MIQKAHLDSGKLRFTAQYKKKGMQGNEDWLYLVC